MERDIGGEFSFQARLEKLRGELCCTAGHDLTTLVLLCLGAFLFPDPGIITFLPLV